MRTVLFGTYLTPPKTDPVEKKFAHVIHLLYLCILFETDEHFVINRYRMKKSVLLLMMALMAIPCWAQLGERLLNRRYQNEIRDSLTGVMVQRQRDMQRYAEQTLAALPNDQKLYDESYISVVADLIDTFYDDGRMRLDLVYRLSYNCKHLEGWTDDYPLGTYDVDSSNSCRAICNLTRTFLQHTLADAFKPGKEVDIVITSSADGTEFTNTIDYDGRYGDFRYCPVVFNGERLRLSVDRTTGITNNCQLAYLRAQSVRAFLENNVAALRQTNNNYRYITQSYKDSVNTHYYRRSMIEIRVNDVFSETVERMQRERMQDDYVDYNIPVTTLRSPNTYVLVIANEQYNAALIPDVPFALNDGERVRQYMVSALGVPERQVKVLKNATKADIEQEGIHWLQDLAHAVAKKNGEQTEATAEFIIYYAGHGFTDLDGMAYLLPNGINTEDIDALQPGKGGGCHLFGCGKKKQADTLVYDIVLSKKETRRLAEQCLSIDDLCAAFNSKTVPVKNLTVIVDASFDGNGRDGKPIVRADRKKDDKKKRRKASLRSDAVVLLAAEYDKTAFSFDRFEHGFLTYFLLKEVKDQKDNIFQLDYQDIFEDVARRLNKESALQNKWQEASGIAGGRYKDGWQRMKIRN